MNAIEENNKTIKEEKIGHVAIPIAGINQQVFVSHFIKAVANGEINPLELRVKFKVVQNAIDQILKSEVVSDAVINEFDNHGEDIVDVYGAEIKKNSRTNYDFKHDAIWVKINQGLKDREGLLKAVKPGKSIYDPETGAEIGHSIKNVSQFLVIKLK